MIYEKKYKSLLAQIINNGNFRQDRTGIGTKSLFNPQLSSNIQASKELGKEIKVLDISITNIFKCTLEKTILFLG